MQKIALLLVGVFLLATGAAAEVQVCTRSPEDKLVCQPITGKARPSIMKAEPTPRQMFTGQVTAIVDTDRVRLL